MFDAKYIESLIEHFIETNRLMEECIVRIDEGLQRIDERLASMSVKAQPQQTSSNYSEAFERFWISYPKHRRNYKPQCFKFWQKNGLDLIEYKVMDALTADKKDAQWTAEGGQYVPGVKKWLEAERWNNPITEGHARPSSLAELDAIEAQFGMTLGPPQV